MGLSTAKSFNFFVSRLNGTHQASNALHTNIILILPFQENTDQDTPPWPFGNYISRYKCNPCKDAPCHGFAFPTSSSGKRITTVFVENTEGTRCSATIFSSTVKGSFRKFRIGWDGFVTSKLKPSREVLREKRWAEPQKRAAASEKNCKTKGLPGSGKLARHSCWKKTHPWKRWDIEIFWTCIASFPKETPKYVCCCWWKKSCTTWDVKKPCR